MGRGSSGGGGGGGGGGYQRHRAAVTVGRSARVAQSPTGSGEGSDWGREWRAQISREVENSAEKHEKTAIIQERMMGVLDNHDSRLKALEGRPDGLRANLGSYGGCLSQILYAGLSSLSMLISIVALLYTILHHP